MVKLIDTLGDRYCLKKKALIEMRAIDHDMYVIKDCFYKVTSPINTGPLFPFSICSVTIRFSSWGIP